MVEGKQLAPVTSVSTEFGLGVQLPASNASSEIVEVKLILLCIVIPVVELRVRHLSAFTKRYLNAIFDLQAGRLC